MGKRKTREGVESDSDLEFRSDTEDAQMLHYTDNEDECEDGTDQEEEEGYEDTDIEDDGQGSEYERNFGVPEVEEMEELEKERAQLRDEEQDILRNLKIHKDEDVQKGQAVKNQRALWDMTLEFRFLLQKTFSNSNRLPQEPVRSLFCNADNGVNGAYSDLITSSKTALDSILELQQALLVNNPSIGQASEANVMKNSKQIEDSGKLNDTDDEWLQIAQMQSRISSFRNKSIDKWQRKTQVTTGAAAIRGKLQAFNQSISEQVAAYMRDPSKMIKGMQQNRSAVAVFGNVAVSTENTKQEETNASGDPELLDDSQFYQQLLKEFFETIDPSSSEAALYAMKRLQTKKRKVVDRRASKSRKIRYNVHEKIVNFMAPRPMDIPPMAPKLFENMFGPKIRRAASGA